MFKAPKSKLTNSFNALKVKNVNASVNQYSWCLKLMNINFVRKVNQLCLLTTQSCLANEFKNIPYIKVNAWEHLPTLDISGNFLFITINKRLPHLAHFLILSFIRIAVVISFLRVAGETIPKNCSSRFS